MSIYDRQTTVKNSLDSYTKKIDESKTFKSYRKKVADYRDELVKQKAELAPTLDKWRGMFAPEYYKQKESELTGEYKHNLAEKREKLTQELRELTQAKRAQASEFFTKAPDEELLRTLQVLSLQGGNISEGQVDMLIEKCAGNYLALNALKTIAQGNGFDFILTVDPADANNALDKAERICTSMLDILDKDAKELNYTEMEFLADTSNGLVASLLTSLDDEGCFRIAEPIKAEPTRAERLDQAIDQASANKDYFKYVKLRELKEKQGDALLTDAEKEHKLDKMVDDAIEG